MCTVQWIAVGLLGHRMRLQLIRIIFQVSRRESSGSSRKREDRILINKRPLGGRGQEERIYYLESSLAFPPNWRWVFVLRSILRHSFEMVVAVPLLNWATSRDLLSRGRHKYWFQYISQGFMHHVPLNVCDCLILLLLLILCNNRTTYIYSFPLEMYLNRKAE